MTESLGDRLDHAPCGFASFADDSRITGINATLLERLDYSAEDLIGKHFETILTIPGRIFHQTHFFPLIKLHGRAQEVFMLLRTRAGDDVGMLCNAVRRERAGTPETDCVFMEVQERRKFEDALLQARAAADEANKAKSNFLAVMSHELRTPLNAISGYVQLLDMGVHGPVTQAQRDTLARIDRSERHLLRLINDVLNLARIEAGRVDYVSEPVTLADIMASTLPMVEPQMAAKRLRLESSVTDEFVVKADRDKVQQVVLNLLTNATKFTPPDGSVRVQAAPRGDSEVMLSVIDTGIGIPSAMVEKVFEPFIQVDASHSRAGEGTGLGLAISRDLARGMGGDLFAESTLGKGSAFHLVLPLFAPMQPR
jgi:signal transduction histidine kinase